MTIFICSFNFFFTSLFSLYFGFCLLYTVPNCAIYFLNFWFLGEKYLFGASSLSPSVSLDGLRAASVLPDSRAIDRLLAWRTISFLAGGRGRGARRGLASWIKVWHWSRSLAAVTLAYDIKNYDKFDPLRFLYTHIRNGFSVSFETQMTPKNYFLQITSIRSNLTFVYCFRRLLILLIFHRK